MEKPGVIANVPRVAQLLDSERKSTFYRRDGIGFATTKESQKQNSCVAGTGSLFKRLAGWAQPHRPGERSPVLTLSADNSGLGYKVGAGQSGHVSLEKDHDGPLEETGS